MVPSPLLRREGFEGRRAYHGVRFRGAASAARTDCRGHGDSSWPCLVRSPVSATLPQIGSRLFLTWGILWSFPETRAHILVSSLVISWSITEIIRYSFFGMKEAFGFAPSWLLWLRYSTFLILYPTGITSEVGLLYVALPYIKASEKYCIRMPNKWNFSFDYFSASILALAIYIPGSPHMYQYMLGQRRKALSKSKTA
uniref:Very-long-chain (3R)-3-hydroxyacyl-CoA dehydratase n=1 Tax=Musa acuminata subsp. malaccensis TaxID=214687 RepID=A0A804KZ89_MUSAM